MRLKAVPILRIMDVPTTKEFYGDFLGCQVDWQHYYEDGAPVYMQMSRNEFVVQLSENNRYREGTIVFVDVVGIEELHDELSQKCNRWETPTISLTPWNTKQMEIQDPFGNLLRFNESVK
jgi:extradiol dioxygenase family protein